MAQTYYSIHGVAMQIERPENLETIFRWGPGITVKGKVGTTNVFHFPIPTQVKYVEAGDYGLEIIGARIYLNTDNGAWVKSIYVNDGSDLLYGTNFPPNNYLKGKHSPWDINFNQPYKRATKAVNIVVHVEFSGLIYDGMWPPKLIDPGRTMSFEAAAVKGPIYPG